MNIIGHQRQQQILDSHIAKDKLSHAYLFSGPEHIGKMAVARAFAQKILPGASHPDLVILDSDSIGIGDIRELKDRAGRTALGGGYKVFIISDASRMSREAANSLLKILEEPLGKTVFILIASSAEAVLPTILSRVWHLKFWPVSKELVQEALIREKVGSERASLLAEVSFGHPGTALSKLEHSEAYFKKETERLLKEFNNSIAGPVHERFSFAEKIARDFETYEAWYNEMIALMRLIMHRELGIGTSNTSFPMRMPLLQTAAALQNLIQRHPQMLRPYTNKKLLMEAALFSVRSANPAETSAQDQQYAH